MTNGCDHEGCIEPAEYYCEYNYKMQYYCHTHKCVECKEIHS